MPVKFLVFGGGGAFGGGEGVEVPIFIFMGVEIFPTKRGKLMRSAEMKGGRRNEVGTKDVIDRAFLAPPFLS